MEMQLMVAVFECAHPGLTPMMTIDYERRTEISFGSGGSLERRISSEVRLSANRPYPTSFHLSTLSLVRYYRVKTNSVCPNYTVT